MIPEFGHFALILALGLATLLAVVPMWGSWRGDRQAMEMAPSLAIGMFVFVVIAFACLAHSFVTDDFSVALVANNSNSLMPTALKFAATWGNHEGSMVLWILLLSTWTAAVAVFSTGLPLILLARVLAVLGFVAVGFLLFSLLTSNPFARLLPGIPPDGADLNPLLQDPGMIFHPPLLYMGYVGFSVAFAFAIAALIGGRLDASWARWSRPWTNAAWAFLSLGIMLGSWWAYYELGWGGWWFWDPVENASFMPWLAGTALIHSLAVTEKRGLFRSWTVLLAIFTFSLSLLGTFLVRSGVLTSVHAFAADPERGIFILAFLGIVIGGSLTLYALRAPAVQSRIGFEWVSRESLLLLNNVVFLVSTLTVLFGTLFPLITDALSLGKYSVGPPYFNAVFLPLMALLIPFMGVGPASRWKRDTTTRWIQELMAPALAAVIIGLTFPFAYGDGFNLWVALAAILAGWLALAMLRDLIHRVRNASNLAVGLRRLPASYWGMQSAHLGFAITVAGVVLTSQYAVEQDLKMTPGDSHEVAGYVYRFDSVEPVTGPNYVADGANFTVLRDDKVITTLQAQKRRYLASGQVMTEAAIDAGLFRDLFIAMGEPLDQGRSWAIRLHHKPFVRWIWAGALCMGLGGFVTLLDKRYRRVRQRRVAAEAGLEAA
ncbi:MAG: heme lyase CcmF/NrfE family subunit [Pseudomonadota bacterium]